MVKRVRRLIHNKDSIGYLFVAPGLIYLATLLLYPIIYNVWLSLFRSSYGTRTFVGLQNYARVITSRGFGQVMLNTLIWTAVNMLVMYLLAILAATLLQSIKRGKVVFRTILLLPWVVPAAVAGVLWRFMLHVNYGVINDILLRIGLITQPIGWLSNPHTSLASVMVTYIWKVYPYVMILLMAGLEAIPKHLYEAARIDGATGWEQFRHVTLPLLAPITRVVVVLMGIWTFNAFDLTYIMTRGGPLYSSEVLAMRIYTTAFTDFRFGLASATSVLAFLMTFAFAGLYTAWTKRREQW